MLYQKVKQTIHIKRKNSTGWIWAILQWSVDVTIVMPFKQHERPSGSHHKCLIAILVAKGAKRSYWSKEQLPFRTGPDRLGFSLINFERVIHAYITSRLDHNNSLYVGVGQISLCRLQLVHNAAAQALTWTWKREYVTLFYPPCTGCLSILEFILKRAFKCLNGLTSLYQSAKDTAAAQRVQGFCSNSSHIVDFLAFSNAVQVYKDKVVDEVTENVVD